MTFKSGAEWNGNRFGAPKKEFRRDAMTEKMVRDRAGIAEEITEVWLNLARDGKPWAIKEFIRIFYTTPKSRDEADNEDQARLVSRLVGVPKEGLEELRELISKLLAGEIEKGQ